MPITAHRTPMSWEEYEALSHDDVLGRGEYIDGELVVTPAPSHEHQDVARRLANLLEAAVGDAAVVVTGWGWKPGADEFIPDVMLHEPTHQAQRLVEGIPLLAVEILSSDPARDTVLKFAKYAAAKLPRYWIVDPAGPQLMAFELTGGGYRPVGEFGPDDEADLDVGPARVRFRPEDLRY